MAVPNSAEFFLQSDKLIINLIVISHIVSNVLKIIKYEFKNSVKYKLVKQLMTTNNL